MSRIQRLCAILSSTWTNARRAACHPNDVNDVTREWAIGILNLLRVKVSQSGAPAPSGVVLVGSHVSYVDIPLLMSLVPVNFLAKSELQKWPIFGQGMKAAGTHFVDRSSKMSRGAAGDLMAVSMKQTGRNVCLFPSGTTTVDESVAWRHGIFHTAKKHDLPVQPFRLTYLPLRETAFIGEDAFVPHLWELLKHPVEARIEFLEPRRIKDPEADCAELWKWARAMVH